MVYDSNKGTAKAPKCGRCGEDLVENSSVSGLYSGCKCQREHTVKNEKQKAIKGLFDVEATVEQQPVQQAAFTHHESAGRIVLTNHTQPAAKPASVGHAKFTPADRRQEIRLANHQVMGPWTDRTNGQSLVELYPDEYIYDGGDRNLPVHYDEFTRYGLDTEDTVAEYTDHRGKHRMKPSNRVAIYAPRFGAVRNISQLESGISIEQVHIASDEVVGSGLTSQLAPGAHLQRDPASGLRMRSRASGLDVQAGDLILNQNVVASRHTQNLNTYQNLTFFRTGQFEQSERARLNYGIQAAATWSRTQYPVVTASNSEAQQMKSHFKESVLVGIETDTKDGDLRIVKTADRKEASIGEIVTFTIRYDNLGDHELNDLRVVDNLTPRMDYVEDSAHSDRPGRLVVEDNFEGSLILKFEVDGPLPGNEGGTVTFQARVR